MLFKKKKCENCQSEYDVVEATCPACGTQNEEVQKLRINQNIIWLPWWRQLLIFLIGILGLQIAATVLSIIFLQTLGDTLEASLTVNALAYVLALGGIAIGLYPYYKRCLGSFKKWLPYVIGLAGAIAIYLLNAFYGSIISQFIETTNNENESTAESMLTAYPAISMIMIVILGPVCEELTYRVGLFSLLKRVNTALAYVVVAVIFGFIHFNFGAIFGGNIVNELANLPFYMGAGLVMCYLYDKFGLAASLTAHITNNLISSLLALFVGATQ